MYANATFSSQGNASSPSLLLYRNGSVNGTNSHSNFGSTTSMSTTINNLSNATGTKNFVWDNNTAANTSTSSLNKGLAKGEAGKFFRYLPNGFTPGPFDVICGRGRRCFNHVGNRRFRTLISKHLQRYSLCLTKLQKTTLLGDLVLYVRRLSPGGGFVKKDSKTGRWYEIGDFLAREKTSQAFRDAMAEQFKSSSNGNLSGGDSKKKRSRANENMNDSWASFGSSGLGKDNNDKNSNEDSFATGDLPFSYNVNSSEDLDTFNEPAPRPQLKTSAISQVDLRVAQSRSNALQKIGVSCPDFALGRKKKSTFAPSFNNNVGGKNFEWSTHSPADPLDEFNASVDNIWTASRHNKLTFGFDNADLGNFDSFANDIDPLFENEDLLGAELLSTSLNNSLSQNQHSDDALFERLMAISNVDVSDDSPFEPVPLR